MTRCFLVANFVVNFVDDCTVDKVSDKGWFVAGDANPVTKERVRPGKGAALRSGATDGFGMHRLGIAAQMGFDFFMRKTSSSEA